MTGGSVRSLVRRFAAVALSVLAMQGVAWSGQGPARSSAEVAPGSAAGVTQEDASAAGDAEKARAELLDAVFGFDTGAVARVLAATPAAVNARDVEGQTALHLAVRRGAVREAAMLIEGGADARAADTWGRTVLHYAAMNNQSQIIAPLTGAGASVDAVDSSAETALHTAARRLRLEAAQELLVRGANPNAVNAQGRTPLHLAVDQGSCHFHDEGALIRFAELLVGAGANVAALDARGSSAHAIAMKHGHRSAAAWLAERGGRAAGEVLPPDVLGEGAGLPGQMLAVYRTYAEIGPLLATLEANYPAIAKRYDLGASVQGRRLWAIRLSDNVGTEEDEPEVKLISTMHGDEIIGVEMCLQLAEYLTGQYGIDSRATDLVNGVDLWILPLMNPDGYDRSPRTRANANGVDLNRNFPDVFSSPNNTTAGRQVETAAIMNWGFGRHFVLSVNFHGGELVVNYPYDNNPGSVAVYTTAPDDDKLVDISEGYSVTNPPMWSSGSFFHGITNGADWYAVDGGMQDWSYRYMGCVETTIELGTTKQPPATDIPVYWANNRDSMLTYVESALSGIRGLVTDRASGLPVTATIRAEGRANSQACDDMVGNYHRMVEPGTHSLRVSAAGYDTVRVENISVATGPATRVDIAMGGPAAGVQSPNGGETLEFNVPVSVTWTGDATAQFQVQHTTDFGNVTVDADGFEGGSLGGDYASGGQAAWFATTGSAHAGTFAARSGAIGNSQRTWIERWVQGSQVSFWYRMSSESGFDFFTFFLDGEPLVLRSGTVNWTSFSTPLSEGPHLLVWEYVKDSSGVSGSDAAWIDDVQVTMDETAWEDIEALTAVGATSASWTPTVETPNARVRVRAYYGGGAYGQWDVSGGDFSVENTGGVGAPIAADAPHNVTKERYLSFQPGNAIPVAFEVALQSSTYFPGSVGTLGWVGAPDANGVAQVVDTAVFRTWTEPVVQVADCAVTPAATYTLRATANGSSFSAPLAVSTTPKTADRFWGDLVGAPSGGVWPPPDGTVNGFDITATLRGFAQDPSAPHFSRLDVNPQEPDKVANGSDVLQIVRAFQVNPYPFVGPAACP